MTRAVQFVGLLPRNACVLVLRVYRAVVSPLYGDVCRYYPSCSRYALEAIQLHGVVRGVAMGSWRIARCHPWAAGGVDDVPEPRTQKYHVTKSGFVTPRSTTATADLVGSGRIAAQSHGKG
ncbi:membrane protein insertion efficiency factor YidD [Frigoribacterium sp. VKM Ac-1396]|uniref:membrane protein insertion efficiency factor YidD n=1 Tax=Frigoribacterium sp. VKM Ac-1396 TaxID=2783821 RepID=UPI00188B8FF7|nr:membrane protein insertion efficiency factor YidD [Frigoribacterium sp. VKM Ac-1396]